MLTKFYLLKTSSLVLKINFLLGFLIKYTLANYLLPFVDMCCRMQLLNEVTHVRLDRENLQVIDGLELLGSSVKNLYLQHVS